MRQDYHVYVIETRDSWGRKRFYVGQSAKEPSVRLREHQHGKRYCKGCKPRKYAAPGKSEIVKLRWDLFAQYNPLSSRREAEAVEAWLGKKLRDRGYDVIGGR